MSEMVKTLLFSVSLLSVDELLIEDCYWLSL